ncbi:hypothetical protein GCM10009687_56260 [Asanoa iriomotensis]|uniref:Uncharacterized protein n=1 Tax=Asanoa iriomotensis TaxID=234613 RepID=A0ABQ4CH54_9ACTN|nr:hypothetical protein Air01nite_77400 [Asanoa iriomotensis]
MLPRVTRSPANRHQLVPVRNCTGHSGFGRLTDVNPSTPAVWRTLGPQDTRYRLSGSGADNRFGDQSTTRNGGDKAVTTNPLTTRGIHCGGKWQHANTHAPRIADD